MPEGNYGTAVLDCNRAVIAQLRQLSAVAASHGDEALMNFCADRLTRHGKYGWQLVSMLKARNA
jgi:DNA-binding ferritin-like protein